MAASAIEKECSAKMASAVEFLKTELRGVRTGRAHPGLVEHLKIEVKSYGSTMELRELATISVPDPSTLLVKPFDPGTLADIERGINTSDVGITPQSDGKAIRLPVPTLSSASLLDVVFNDGAGVWDNNNGQDFHAHVN